MSSKQYRLTAADIRPLVPGRGACFATDRITIDGEPVRFMYREEPDKESDSGWRFVSGLEDDAYMDDAANHGVFDVNTIANYDPAIIPQLDAPIGAAFARDDATSTFFAIGDDD